MLSLWVVTSPVDVQKVSKTKKRSFHAFGVLHHAVEAQAVGRADHPLLTCTAVIQVDSSNIDIVHS